MYKIKKETFKVINYFIYQFKKNPYLYLTEGDIQAYLLKDLSENEFISGLEESIDSQKTYRVHSEVSFFKEDNQLGPEIDLVIFNVKNLNLYSTEESLKNGIVHKGFEFYDGNIAIELKINRGNKSKNQVISDIKSD